MADLNIGRVELPDEKDARIAELEREVWRLREIEQQAQYLRDRNQDLRTERGRFHDHIRNLEFRHDADTQGILALQAQLSEAHKQKRELETQLRECRAVMTGFYEREASISSPDTRWESARMRRARQVLGLEPKEDQ